MDKSRLYGNLDTGKEPFGRCFSLSGAEAQPSQNYSNTDAATCFAGMVVFCGLLWHRGSSVLWNAQNQYLEREHRETPLMVGQAAVRQGSDQSTTARGHPVELRYGAVACWSIIFGGSSFFLKCPNINIYIYTYIHNKHIIYIVHMFDPASWTTLY